MNVEQVDLGTMVRHGAKDWVWLAMPKSSRSGGTARDWVWLPVPESFRDFLADQEIGSEESEFDFLRGSLERFAAQCADGIEAASKTLKLIGDW